MTDSSAMPTRRLDAASTAERSDAASRMLARSRTLPAARRQGARIQLQQILAQGLPRYRQEAWRHTDPELLLRADRLLAPEDATSDPVLPSGPQALATVVFVNGRRCPQLETVPPEFVTSDGDALRFEEPMAAASAALATDGVDFRFADFPGLVRIVSLVTPAAAGGAVHLRHRLRLSGASKVVFEQYGPPDLEYESQCCMKLEIGGDTQLQLWQDEGLRAHCYQHLAIEVEPAARLRLLQANAGGGLVRTEIRAHGKQGATITMRQLNLADGRRRVDSQLTSTHLQAGVTGDTLVRSIAGGRGKIAVDGLIHILPGASGADGQMQVAGLLLSTGAEIAAKPALLIRHDDVKCSHGATCGALDESALHYLRSRGIGPDQARRLLLQAFAAEVLTDITDDASSVAWLRHRLENKLSAYAGSEL